MAVRYVVLEPKDHFFVVWNETTKQVVKQHAFFGTATKEAKRLSRKHPLFRFYVLRAIISVEEELTHDTPISLNDVMRLPPELCEQLSKRIQNAFEKLKEQEIMKERSKAHATHPHE